MKSKKDIYTVARILATEIVVNNGMSIQTRIDEGLLAELIPMLQKAVSVLLNNPTDAYKRIEIPKKSGGIRVIHAPLGEGVMEESLNGDTPYSILSILQKRINYILGVIPLPRQICAFRHGIDPYSQLRGTLDAIVPGASVAPPALIGGMFKIDIKDFFNSITSEQIKNAWALILPRLTKEKISAGIIDILVLLSSYDGKLNQGPSSSPMLANIVGYQLFESKYLNNVERTQGISRESKGKEPVWVRYLRYADDIIVLSINGSVPIDIPNIIKCAITDGGFSVAEQKTQLLNNESAYPLLGISLKRDIHPNNGFQFQIGTSRDKSTAQEILEFDPDSTSSDSLIGKLEFNERISKLGRAGYSVKGYDGLLFSKRVAHALSKREIGFLDEQ